MKIQVLGPGCKRSKALLEHVKEAAESLGLGTAVEEITDPQTIAALGVLSAPGLAVDGQVLASGRVLSVKEARKLLREAGG